MVQSELVYVCGLVIDNLVYRLGGRYRIIAGSRTKLAAGRVDPDTCYLLLFAYDNRFNRPFQDHDNIRLVSIAGSGWIGNGAEKQQLCTIEIAPDAYAILRHLGYQNRCICGDQNENPAQRCHPEQKLVNLLHSGCTV